MRRFTPIIPIFLALSTGCGDQVTPEYEGEPLAMLRGVFVSELPVALPEVDIVMAWPDWSKIETDETGLRSTGVSTFVRLPVEATLPARFTASIVAPPPETAYLPASDELPRLIGPRYASASFLLARKGKEIKNDGYPFLEAALADPNQVVLTGFRTWMLTYVESDGVFSVKLEDGTIVGAEPVKKGFHLTRVEPVECRIGDPDPACVAEEMSFGWSRDIAERSCVTIVSSSNNTEVPLDTEITLTLEAPDEGPQPLPPVCEDPPV